GSAADRFVDDDRSVHEGSINAIAEAGLVDGCNPPENDRLCPDRHVTRAEMAKIIASAVGIPASANRVFRDGEDSLCRASTSGARRLGLAQGCNPPVDRRVCPRQIVGRGQMAAFLVRALELPDADRSFVDTANSVFENDIARLAAAGV